MPRRRLIMNADLTARTLRIQRLDDGTEIAHMKCYPDIYPAVSLTENLLAVAESESEIRIWNALTWQPGRILKSPANERIWEMHFSADEKWLVAGCGKRVAGAWNLQTGEWCQLVDSEVSDESVIVRCSPIGNVAAIAAFHNNVVELWQLDQPQRLDRLVLDSAAHCLCFSPDGRLLAVGERDLTISLWDTATGTKIDTLTGHAREVTRLAFSPDGRTLVTCSTDGTARLWSVAARRELFVLCRSGKFNWLSFVNGSLLIAQGRDNKLLCFPGERETVSSQPAGARR